MDKVLGILFCGIALPCLFIEGTIGPVLGLVMLAVGNEFLRAAEDNWERWYPGRR
ncbi:hypothetical protein [Methyloversatilis sp.]|uniref:hypothetical protein n=1 Tax=Methyloversatilis sp. TaxID=2569862 RepID=UPI0035B46372